MIVKSFFDISGKVAVITGGTGGLGIEIAKGLSSAECKVIVSSRNAIKQNKLFDTFNADITNKEDIKKLIKYVINKYKKIDILINAVGYTKSNNFLDYEDSDWTKTIDTNLTGVMQCCKLVAKEMIKKKKGSIINLTSIASELANHENPAYSASKGGLKLLTKSMARDLAKYNIRVNNIGPGYFETKFNIKSLKNKKQYNLRASRSMMNRWGKPKEIIGPIIFLSSEASSYITAQDIYIDGGTISKFI